MALLGCAIGVIIIVVIVVIVVAAFMKVFHLVMFLKTSYYCGEYVCHYSAFLDDSVSSMIIAKTIRNTVTIDIANCYYDRCRHELQICCYHDHCHHQNRFCFTAVGVLFTEVIVVVLLFIMIITVAVIRVLVVSTFYSLLSPLLLLVIADGYYCMIWSSLPSSYQHQPQWFRCCFRGELGRHPT